MCACVCMCVQVCECVRECVCVYTYIVHVSIYSVSCICVYECIFIVIHANIWCCVHMYLCMLATTRKTTIVLRAHVCIYIGCICIYVFMYFISW